MEENKIVIYQTEDGQTQIDVRLDGETVWLTANQMGMLFDRDVKTVRKHINNLIMCLQNRRYPKITTRIFCVLMV